MGEGLGPTPGSRPAQQNGIGAGIFTGSRIDWDAWPIAPKPAVYGVSWTNSSPRRLPPPGATWSGRRRMVILGLIATSIDRKCDLQRDYAAAVEPKVRVKVSAELRLAGGRGGQVD